MCIKPQSIQPYLINDGSLGRLPVVRDVDQLPAVSSAVILLVMPVISFKLQRVKHKNMFIYIRVQSNDLYDENR